MIQVKKKKLDKKQLTIVITASVLAFLIIAYAVVSMLISSGVIGGAGDGSSKPIEVLEGESIANGKAVAYPYISRKNIVSVAVNNHNDTFSMTKPEKAIGGYEDYFVFHYQDTNGDIVSYSPQILSKDNNTAYTDFYSQETEDGLGAAKIDYICAAVGAMYFEERISPEENKEAQLRRYGLDDEHRETILISYLDSEGKPAEIKIFVGDSLITGVGYYYMIEGRDYIYTSTASERLEYLLSDFETFLHSRVVAMGIPEDGLYEPFLTTDYKQWTNKYYGKDDYTGTIPDGVEVIVKGDIISPIYEKVDKTKTEVINGYIYDKDETISIDLSYIKNQPQFNRLANLIKSSVIGDYSDLIATVITNANAVKLNEDLKPDANYEYTIKSVESVLASDKEYFENGYAVGDNDLVKIIYDYKVDGEKQNDDSCHGIISLSDSKIPEAIRTAIRNSKVGDELNLTFDIDYTEETAHKRNIKTVITEISIISKLTDTGALQYPEQIDEKCAVTYSYKVVVDDEMILDEGMKTIDLSSIKEGSLKEALIGKKLGKDLNITASEDEIYCQVIANFVTYSIQTIKGFVEKELVVSFEYINASERDPFYRESIYKNTLDNENKKYALDATACQNVTFLLGGLGASNNSQMSGGLVGSETVAVGLTPANMVEFDLYDGYTIYFELPRGITSIPGSAENEAADFKHLSTLGFKLYISKEQEDGSRYIGSDMYDIIVKIDGAGFEFLEKSFEEYWIRRNLVMVDISDIDKVTVELGMEDVYGKYDFDLDHQKIYISNGQHLTEKPATGGTEYNFITLYLSSQGEIPNSVYSDILKTDLDGTVGLNTIYETVSGFNTVGNDTEATANFKVLLNMIYSTNYFGELSGDELSKDEAPKIMSLTFKLEGEKNNGNQYVYDFYRVSDRRVMVDLYRIDSEGNRIDNGADDVSGFYISTFAAKKIINGVSSLLNGETVDQKLGYWD